MNPAPNLFFIGPMGAGKTTIGRRVAETLCLPFFDLDREIEVRTGTQISTIFDIEGEHGFRQREIALLAEFAMRPGIVLATGGGIVLDENNRHLLRNNGFVVWLDISVDAQLKRLSRDRQRPLLATPDRNEYLQQLTAIRNPLYEEIADLRVASLDVGNSIALTSHLITLIKNRWRRSA